MWRSVLKYAVFAAALLLAAIQFIQPQRTNPPADPSSDFEAAARPVPQVASLVRRACYDCHSHNTVWPWYSRIAPVSWLIAGHVEEGRRHLNFSRWDLLGADMSRARLREACEEAREGGMPLLSYRLMHPEARLSAEDIEALCEAGGRIP